MKKLLWPVLVLGISLDASAQAQGTDDSWDPRPPRWSVGLAAVAADSPYAGEGTRIMPIPMVSYQGERFSFRGLSANWRIWSNESFELSALGKFRFDGFEVDDLGKRELARNGIDYRLIEDRDKSFDLGLAMKWNGRAGEIEAELLADATDTSGGQEINLQYGYPIQIGNGMLTPNIGLTWMSRDMADYYYGTLDKEVARGVVDYKPGSVTIPHVGAGYFQPIGEKWTLMGFLKYSRLPDGIQDSPFIEPDTDSSVSMMIGLSRGF